MDSYSDAESSDSDEEEELDETSDLFNIYTPSTALGGANHPGTICESSSLAFVSSPKLQIRLNLPPQTVENISHLQAETVALACQKMREFLPDGCRAGFYLGDGTGVGKGRILASIIQYHYMRGRTRSILVTAGRLLLPTLEQDLSLIGYERKVIELPDNYDPIPERHGVLFLTYSSLYSKSKSGMTRMDQICNWLGNDFCGVIAFDESHKAKKFANDPKLCTVTGFNVVAIQDRFPKAHVIYSSATAAWEPEHLCYMTRLGLWHQAFGNSAHFLEAMKSRPVEAMELLAIELKLTGFYIARQLSFKDVTFELESIALTADFENLYDECAKLWRSMLRYMRKEIVENNLPQKVTGLFWAYQQRFFASLCTSSKTLKIVERSRKATTQIEIEALQSEDMKRQNMAVVIGIQSTGEAGFTEERVGKKRLSFDTPFSLARHILSKCVTGVLRIPEVDGSSQDFKNCSFFSIIVQLTKVLHVLPRNPLDDVISSLGGFDCVAEMTGRTARECEEIYEDGVKKYSCQYRKSSSNESDRAMFMYGAKKIIVISDAASTGISLHDEKLYKANRRRRLHITAELPWGADKAIQQLGRTHRSNQESAPHYVFVISPVPAERRFTFAIADRLRQMGALTHGDRRATNSLPFSEFELSRSHTRKALVSLLKFFTGTPSAVLSSNTPLLKREKRMLTGKLLGADILKWKALTAKQSRLVSAGRLKKFIVSSDQTRRMMPNSACFEIDKFLNRMFLIDIQGQTRLFSMLEAQLAYEIKVEKDSGEYSSHIKDLTRQGKTLVKLYLGRKIKYNLKTGPIELNEVIQDSGMSWKEAHKLAIDSPVGSVLFFKTASKFPRVFMAIRSPNPENQLFTVFRPSIGQQNGLMSYHCVHDKTTRIKSAEVKLLWKKEYFKMAEKSCWHELSYGKCAKNGCTSGSRISRTSILSGCLNKVWNEILDSTHSKSLQVVKCTLQNKAKIIGVRIKADYVKDLDATLTALERDFGKLKIKLNKGTKRQHVQ